MLFKLLTLPVLAPVRTTGFLLNQIRNMAERELYDIDNLHEQLLLLQLNLEQGELSEEAFAEREAEIIGRLRVARQMRGEGPGA